MPQAALFFRTQPLDQSIAKRIYTLSHIDKFYYAPLYALYKPTINVHLKVFASRLVSTFTFYIPSPSTMASPTLLPRRRNPYGLLWWIVPVGVGVFGMRELFILPFALIFSTLPFRRRNPYMPLLWFIPVGIYVFRQPFVLLFMSNSSAAPFFALLFFLLCFLFSLVLYLFSETFSMLPLRRRNPYRLLLWFVPVGVDVCMMRTRYQHLCITILLSASLCFSYLSSNSKVIPFIPSLFLLSYFCSMFYIDVYHVAYMRRNSYRSRLCSVPVVFTV